MKRPRLVAGAKRRPLPGGEEVVTTADGANAVILNAVGAAVVDLCTGERTAGEVAAVVASCFDGVDGELVRQDVEAVLDELGENGVVVEGE